MADSVKIVEVGPRDGLQNEVQQLSIEEKVSLIDRLSNTGLKHIECGSFVSPKWVPQMASSDVVFRKINRQHDVQYSALTPNMKGYEGAHEAKVDEVAIFTAASEAFTQKNINCNIQESINRFQPLVEKANKDGKKVRAYVSCVMGCPYEGNITKESVLKVSQSLLDLGCYEVSLGDTIGIGGPGECKQLLSFLASELPVESLACHFHDTYGQAIANQYVALELGYRTFDSSVAGLGGCPYAKGASGNVSTEDTVYMLEKSGIKTGVDLELLIDAGNYICRQLNRANNSKVANALTR